MKIFALAFVALGLAACAQADGKLAMDAGAAAQYATANGDAAAAGCYTALKGVYTVPAGAGVLTGIEKFRLKRQVMQGPCVPVEADILSQILNVESHGLSGLLGF